jgi:hypothetical protein
MAGMGKYRSLHKIWLNSNSEVLVSSEGKTRTLESLHDCDLLLLKDGHAEVRKLAVEPGSESQAGSVAVQVHHVPAVSDHGGYVAAGSDHWYMTQDAVAQIEPNEFAPGAAQYQLDISDD